MSSLVSVHTLAASNGRCIVFPYKPHGLSFSMKLLLIYSSQYRMKVFLRQLRWQWHLLSLTDILHRESLWRRSAGSFHFENISNRPRCWQQRADNVQPPRPWRRGVPAGPTHRWELGNGCFYPLPHPLPKIASSLCGSTLVSSWANESTVHCSSPKLGESGKQAGLLQYSLEENHLYIFLLAFFTNVGISIVKMEVRHYC